MKNSNNVNILILVFLFAIVVVSLLSSKVRIENKEVEEIEEELSDMSISQEELDIINSKLDEYIEKNKSSEYKKDFKQLDVIKVEQSYDEYEVNKVNNSVGKQIVEKIEFNPYILVKFIDNNKVGIISIGVNGISEDFESIESNISEVRSTLNIKDLEFTDEIEKEIKSGVGDKLNKQAMKVLYTLENDELGCKISECKINLVTAKSSENWKTDRIIGTLITKSNNKYIVEIKMNDKNEVFDIDLI